MNSRHCRLHAASAPMLNVVSRRNVLGMSLGSALGWLLRPGLGDLLAGTAGASKGTEKSVILLWMNGGPSHLDSVDPKPGSKFRGLFKPIATATPGVQFTEHLPRLARAMHRLTVIRSMTSEEGEHNRARYYANTGYRPLGSLNNPSLGAIVAHELGPRPMRRTSADGLPHFISIGGPGFGPGYLGVDSSPFIVWNPLQPVRNLGLPAEVTPRRLARRLELLQRFERGDALTAGSSLIHDNQLTREAGLKLLRSRQLRAFRLDDEPAALRDAYGRNPFGQGCLMARRLVESGVRFVQVHLDGWDSHAKNFPTHARLLGTLDPAFSTLIHDLDGRGRLETTLVIWMGEFGRTPKINKNGGRDHHTRAWSVVLAGGGVQGGLVHGASDGDGRLVARDPVTLPDLFATICTALDIDFHQTFIANDRPIKLVDKGKPLTSMLAKAPRGLAARAEA